MKILLLGKTGQVGYELQRSLLPLGTLVSLGRSDVDITAASALQHALETHQPDVIVNATAYTAVDKAETETAAAFLTNATAVEQLATYAQQHQSLLIHYSTDYVFDGNKSSPYVETDSPNPQNSYGASKWAGEQAIRASGCPFLIFRTSWVFSFRGHNFIKTILKLAKERETLNIVSDQQGAPTSAELIADVTALAIQSHRHHLLPSNLYHLTASGATSWHALACYVIQQTQAQGHAFKLSPQSILPIPTEAYPLPAKRPQNSILSTAALRDALNIHLPSWEVYVDRMLDQGNWAKP